MAEFTQSPLFLFILVFGVLGVIVLLAGVVAFMQMRFAQSGIRLGIGLLLLALGALAGTITVGMLGYRALLREDMAARIVVKPTGPQRFTASVRFADGQERTYQLAGDEVYVDANIIKWSAYANMIGLHTAYELDRIGGRYHSLKDERDAERTVHALSRQKPVDLAGLRRRFEILSPLFDAEYGSATFVAVTKPADLELRVSTTGLLIREAKPQ